MNHAAPTDLIALDLPVPPMLETALGYDGPARWVSFWWEMIGDEARWGDGRLELRADWHAWRIFTEHHTVLAALAPYNLGSSHSRAIDRLVLDRGERWLYVAQSEVARAFLDAQWTPRGELPAVEPPATELGDLATEAAAFRPVASPPDLAARVAEQMQQAAVNAEALQGWLAEFLPPDPAAQQARTRQALAELLRWSEGKG